MRHGDGAKTVMKKVATLVLGSLVVAAAAAIAPSVAFAQQTPTDPTTTAPSPAGTDPAAAQPADPNGLTLSTGENPAAKDAVQAQQATEPEAPPKPRPFAGTQAFLQTSMSTATVFAGQQQYNNPTVESSLWLLPRWTISDTFQLRMRWILTYEYTNADNTTTNHELQMSDPGFQLFYRKIPAFAGIKPMAFIGLAPPLSKESRARTVILTPSLGAQLYKGFEHVLGGELSLIFIGTWTHPFYSYTTPGVRGDFPYQRQCASGICSDSGQLSGTANSSDTLSWSFIVSQEWGKWNPAVFFSMRHSFPYRFSDVPGAATTEQSGVRQSAYLSFWLDYNFNSWLTGETGYWMDRPLFDENGTYGNLIFNRYQDTRVYFGFNMNVDSFIQTLQDGKKGSGGVVRAKNERQHRPIGMF